MVYCGKPSRGCQMCRTRRIKCDEGKPTCRQCIKSRRQCPGYKDEFDLVFRNETAATKRRAQKANRKALEKLGRATPGSPASTATGRDKASPASSRRSSAQWSPGPLTASASASAQSSPASTPTTYSQPSSSPCPDNKAVVLGGMSKGAAGPLVPVINVSLDEQATCHFVANFVLISQTQGCSGFLDFVPWLLQQDLPSRPLHHAFQACALGALSNRVNPGNTNLSFKVMSAYTKALKAVHQALQDPAESRSDATLAAILLLGLFENITAKDVGSLAWGTHVQGAVNVVQSRGKRQFRSETGLQLFIAVRVQMLVQTTTTGQAPIYGADWWLADAVSNEVAARNMRLNIQTAELRAELTRLMKLPRTPENVAVMLGMAQRARMLDRSIVDWMASTPARWKFRAVTWEDRIPSSTGGSSNGHDVDDNPYSRVEVFPGRVDAYPDFWIASIWNLARVSRIVLASVVVRCAAWACAPVDYRTTPEYATAARTVVECIADVLASVPYHLCGHMKKKKDGGGSGGQDGQRVARAASSNNNNTSSFACGRDDVQKMLAGYFLTWPLACIYGQDYLTDNQRAYVKGRLLFISDVVGVRYARLIANLDVRIPSMLIRRDGLVATPYPQANDFERLLSVKTTTLAGPRVTMSKGFGGGAGVGAGAGVGMSMSINPAPASMSVHMSMNAQQREALLRQLHEQRKDHLLFRTRGLRAIKRKAVV